jgi:hypothetical protein
MNNVDRITPAAMASAATAIALVVLLGFILAYWNHVKKHIVDTAACKLGKQLKEVSPANML